jgi:putative oxidoreductase
MSQGTQNWLTLIGRVALAWVFILAGYSKLMGIQGTVGYMQKFGMPMADVLVWVAVAIELLGGIALAIGWKTRWVAALLVIFVVIVTLVFHQFWAVDAAQMMNQRNHFMKNLSIVGGMLIIMAFGPGGFSVDGRGRRA